MNLMRFTSETTSDGVSERLFTLGDVTGVLWSPAGAFADRPLVLLAHSGVPLTAAEPRITAAVFGLVAYETLAAAAATISIPLEFWLQWDDELVPRESGLALFDAFASRDKTLHAHPGRHAELPVSERASSQRFLASHLLTK
jgi:hypothetical protein